MLVTQKRSSYGNLHRFFRPGRFPGGAGFTRGWQSTEKAQYFDPQVMSVDGSWMVMDDIYGMYSIYGVLIYGIYGFFVVCEKIWSLWWTNIAIYPYGVLTVI